MKFKLVYIIHGLILILFISSIVYETNQYLDYFAFDEMTWLRFFDSGIYRIAFFLILPTVGVFLRSSIGWLLICQYFYFLFIGSIFMFEEAGIIERLIIIIIPLFFLLFLNYKKIFSYYKIKRKQLLKINIVSFLIGFLFLFISLVIRENYYYL